NELEALESFYPQTLQLDCPKSPSFTMTVTSEAGENDETVQMTLEFTYSEKKAPLSERLSRENLEDNAISDILKLKKDLGVVMIFTLTTAMVAGSNPAPDKLQQNLDERKERNKEETEAERQLSCGTPVTTENFLSWKTKFDAELLEIKKKLMKEEEQAGKNKLSRTQFFKTDRDLDTTDLQFLEGARHIVEVDESSFREMDDLELEDD
uniref:RWD domain containing 1 n=1 Tax=Otolemur garnettii TaxID=30611 RepID=H0XN58_OTOGA